MQTYVSNLPGMPRKNQLRIILEAKPSILSNGMVVKGTYRFVQFVDSVFKTSDESLIKELDSNQLYGSKFCRAEHAPKNMVDMRSAVQELMPPREIELSEIPRIKRFGEQLNPPAPVLPDVESPNAPAESKEEAPEDKKVVEQKVENHPIVERIKPLEEMTLGNLKGLAKELGLKGMVGEKKVDLIARIKGAQAEK